MTITDNDITTTTMSSGEEVTLDGADVAAAVPEELIEAVMANFDAGAWSCSGPTECWPS